MGGPTKLGAFISKSLRPFLFLNIYVFLVLMSATERISINQEESQWDDAILNSPASIASSLDFRDQGGQSLSMRSKT